MRDIARLKRDLEDVERRLTRLIEQQERPDEITRHFHLGRVGGSGRGTKSLNRRKERELDRMIDRGTKITRLTDRRDALRALISAEQNRPARQTAEAEASRRIEAAVREAGVGCTVQSPYGPVRVVRINAKSATIQTASGYREALLWGRVGVVVEAAS